MNKSIKKLIISKAQRKDENGNFILYLYSYTKNGFNFRRIFRGTFKECLIEKRRILDENGL
nr:MAG TPA: hypothetical protein [Caudoviricetes sp.]